MDRLVTGATILIVDDSEVSRDVAGRELGAAGYTTTCARSGREGLAWLEAHAADCVLLDLGIPGEDSFATLRTIRCRWSRSDLPVVVLADHADSVRVVEALSLGANDCAIKPVDMAVLAARVESQVARKRSADLLRVAEPAAPQQGPAPAGVAMADAPAGPHEAVEALLRALPDRLFEIDAAGRIGVLHTPHGLGLEGQDPSGRRLEEVLPPGPAQALQKAVGETLRSGEMQVVEYALSGRVRRHHFEARLVPFEGRVLAVVRDTTATMAARHTAEAQAHLLRQIIDTVPHWITVKDHDRNYLHVNRALAQDLGVDVDALRLKDIRDVGEAMPPPPARLVEMDTEVLSTGRVVEEPALPVTLPDGTTQIRRTVKLPLLDEAGIVQGVVLWSEDVTERVRAEEDARTTAHLLRQILDTLPHWISVKDRDGRYRIVNASMAHGHGLRVDDFQGHFTQETRELQAGGLERMVRLDADVLATGAPVALDEYPVTTPAGEPRIRRLAKFPLHGESGAVEGVVTWSEDVTEQRRSESELQSGRRLLRGIIDSLPFWISVKDRKGKFRAINRAMADALGMTPEQLIGRTNEALGQILKSPLAELSAQDDQVAESGASVDIPQVHMMDADGTLRIRRLAKFPLLDDDGRVEGVVSWSEDITDRLLEEALVERSRRLMAHAEEVAHLGAMEWDLVTGEQFWSDSIYRLIGYAPQAFRATAQAFAGALHPQDKKRVLTVMASAAQSGDPVDLECRVFHKDGSERLVHARGEVVLDEQGRPQRMVGTVQDITEFRKAEAELRRVQRMEALGQLTGSVAHDFNNLMQIVNGYAHLARQRPLGDPLVRDDLQEVLAATDRGSSLAKQLLTFSRRGQVSREVFVLSDLVRGLEKMLRVAVGENVHLVMESAPGTGLVEADPGMLEQVLVNLAINGRDAMPSGGRLSIRTMADPGGLGPGVPAACIQVQDTGVGIAPEIRERIFDPYFTTKGSHGTGLGLATVYGIVRQHGGRIDVETEVGRGTTFTIRLPVVDVDVAPTQELRVGSTLGGAETILVADNDPSQLRMLEMLLRDRGYRPIPARDGDEALAYVRRSGEDIALAVLDVRMPGTDGLASGQQMRALNPRLPIIYTTGDVGFAGLEALADAPGQYLLHKPFNAEHLYAAVRKALDERERAAGETSPAPAPTG